MEKFLVALIFYSFDAARQTRQTSRLRMMW